MKILFVHNSKYEVKDGLWAALNLLEKKSFNIRRINIHNLITPGKEIEKILSVFNPDFCLGQGAFDSMPDKILRGVCSRKKIGLCLGGYKKPNSTVGYNIIFYECEWALKWFYDIIGAGLYKGKLQHAFGINSNIYYYMPKVEKIWDYLMVGSFSLWKRHFLLKNKGGYRLAIGEIQKENISESIDIIGDLLLDGIAVSDMVEPEKLALIYSASKNVYIPALEMGGGERSVLEARACSVPVSVEKDNLKLLELTKSPIWDESYYADKLEKGIESCF